MSTTGYAYAHFRQPEKFTLFWVDMQSLLRVKAWNYYSNSVSQKYFNKSIQLAIAFVVETTKNYNECINSKPI
ncbi:hypothetical protein [Nostoc commune]|uniref:hypothetical protein n=1 Tax=Nostoc commune TaxID=1178 RepID=UPI0018C55895|nr:hypothetical protein [Nostoc commune]MBG1262433.1 hypothetical protein [Nostoc commune BAE]